MVDLLVALVGLVRRLCYYEGGGDVGLCFGRFCCFGVLLHEVGGVGLWDVRGFNL